MTVTVVGDNRSTLLDPVHLRTFLVVSQTLSFTRSAERLQLSQSAVSQHVRRLEEVVGRQLLLRDTHSVELTADGETFAGFARGILEQHEHAVGFFAESAAGGRVRFGASEDFALSRLPDILRAYRLEHPRVDIELTVGLSGTLYRKLKARELDLVLAKRMSGETDGQLVWRDRLVWICAPDFRLDAGQPLPLILYPPPSLSRAMALEVLDSAGVAYRTACTASSLSGLRAAALAGLGVVPHALSLIPPGLIVAPSRLRLPRLGDVEFVLVGRHAGPSPAQRALAQAILDNQDRLLQIS
jgi:DNA-binding transcriptional LysR family regulator